MNTEDQITGSLISPILERHFGKGGPIKNISGVKKSVEAEIEKRRVFNIVVDLI
jgi:hypothetical protein